MARQQTSARRGKRSVASTDSGSISSRLHLDYECGTRSLPSVGNGNETMMSRNSRVALSDGSPDFLNEKEVATRWSQKSIHIVRHLHPYLEAATIPTILRVLQVATFIIAAKIVARLENSRRPGCQCLQEEADGGRRAAPRRLLAPMTRQIRTNGRLFSLPPGLSLPLVSLVAHVE